MSAPFTVFVCSTFGDLEQERTAVLDAIRRVKQGHSAMEFFGAQPWRPLDVCLEEVRKSDLLVVIVGFKYGSIAPGLDISYSQAEYEEGARLEKPCLVYLRDDGVPILPKFVERDPAKIKLLDAWKQVLNDTYTVAKFEDEQGLAVQVAVDIKDFLEHRPDRERLPPKDARAAVTEIKILENVGSYGRQLGRMGDALEVILKHVKLADLKADEQDALDILRGQLAAVRQVKASHTAKASNEAQSRPR
jgi:Domain of unknown function (DUF4062)